VGTFTYVVVSKQGWWGLWFGYGSFIVFVLCQKLCTNLVSTALYRQNQFEQDYSFNTFRVRSQAESIAFYKGKIVQIYVYYQAMD
jgi:ABC-type uncharacterized transport system fused permease/ATPase subunit